eukprot:12101226-Ditylum_brightwellii.AAC.1
MSPTQHHYTQPVNTKFSVSTVKQQDRAYLRLWDPELQQRLGWEAGVPSSKRIVEDMAQIAEYSIPNRYSVRRVVVH